MSLVLKSQTRNTWLKNGSHDWNEINNFNKYFKKSYFLRNIVGFRVKDWQ